LTKAFGITIVLVTHKKSYAQFADVVVAVRKVNDSSSTVITKFQQISSKDGSDNE
jgi:hypothetical protein